MAANTKAVSSPLKPPLGQFNDYCVTGHFDGDQRLDTVCQFLLSDSTGHQLVARPAPTLTDAEQITDWYLSHRATVALTLTRPASDTLRLGSGQGLYCLVNLGDINNDRQDELAFVVNYSDYSHLNSCKIASFCQGKWVVQQQFSVFEAAFEEELPAQAAIRAFLEKRRGLWYYTDYLKDDTIPRSWHQLRVKRCQ